MASSSLTSWSVRRVQQMDEIELAHQRTGGIGPGRRYATQQLNHAYAVLLSSQFQGFCRDLHSECIDHLVTFMQPAAVRPTLRAEFLLDRKLDRGNPTPGNIGADFGRLGIDLWPRAMRVDRRTVQRQVTLNRLNLWRNAIAHQDFDPSRLGSPTVLHLAEIRQWRVACAYLAHTFDDRVRVYLLSVTGANPW